ncbi:MAG TPA: hypothetical protein DCZ03_05170 [Gammaproteobacteria bacterium]|nr:hypothetical protein [Gammaproteobacteria bacterium]
MDGYCRNTEFSIGYRLRWGLLFLCISWGQTTWASSVPTPMELAQINYEWNRYPYRSDLENYGLSDYWATPTELKIQGGDCEDFAIAKYWHLRTLGVAAEHLRLAIVKLWTNNKIVDHMVLLVENERQQVWVLDNISNQIQSIESRGDLQVILEFNEQNLWRFQQPVAMEHLWMSEEFKRFYSLIKSS